MSAIIAFFLAWFDNKQRRYQGKMDKHLKIKFYERNQIDDKIA